MNLPYNTIDLIIAESIPAMAEEKKRNRATYDCDLADIIGLNAAIVFEWLWFFIHSKKNPKINGNVKHGRRWVCFSYKSLHKKSKLLGSQRTLERAIKELEKLGLLITVQHQDSKDYAIHFARLREIVPDWVYQLYVEESRVGDLDDWDMPYTPPKKKVKTTQNGESKTSQVGDPETTPNGQPDSIQDTPETVSRLANVDTQTSQVGDPSIYKESVIFSPIDSTTTPTSVGDAGASDPLPEEPVEILPAKDVFTAISRVTHHGLKISDDDRKAILGAIGKLQNLTTADNEKIVLDPAMIEDFAVWRMLIYWKGKNDFPNIHEFEDEFRYKFISNWYSSSTNQKQIHYLKEHYPDWRTRLFKGDYQAFRTEVQAEISRLQQVKLERQQGKRQSPFTRQGRASTVVD